MFKPLPAVIAGRPVGVLAVEPDIREGLNDAGPFGRRSPAAAAAAPSPKLEANAIKRSSNMLTHWMKAVACCWSPYIDDRNEAISAGLMLLASANCATAALVSERGSMITFPPVPFSRAEEYGTAN